MRRLVFDSGAFNDFCQWSIENKKVFNKIKSLIKNIDRTPFRGIGKPEPLKFNRKGYWSRRINDEHRLIYKVDVQNIYIASCKGHYD
ncbi:Txe/YoeB family addiction module toxin [Mariniphaga sp.]|uniref:Txe/YoeB family addiction module toxin n=1 Tax=Mariniphaga sp. TaxID=1954475 RepID=UPI003563E5BE